jgi:hypothetical protein
LTVRAGNEGVRIVRGPRGGDRLLIEGFLDGRVRLNDDRFLRLSITLFREPYRDGHRLKVEQASYQYQIDGPGDHWIFRYDYLRVPDEPHPASHLQICGGLHEDIALPHGPLERVHFPTGRVSVEAVLRLLIEQFGVTPNENADVWRRVLAESERAFERVASRPLSGPDA